MQKYLIFGATGSVGSNLAMQLSEANKEIHLIGRNEAELEKLSAELGCDYTVLDILSEDIYENLKKNFEDIDLAGIAYCIGSIDLKPIKMTKKSDYMQSFNLNLISAIEIIRRASESLKQNKGSIVLFSTVAVRRGFTNHSIVSSAKGAIEGLTVSLAAEFAPNIRVNCIAPSISKSKIANFILKNEKMADSIAKMHPLKRVGEGSDSASVANFLLSDNSSWITGQILGVDGGRSSLT